MNWLSRMFGRKDKRPFDLVHMVVRNGGFDLIIQAEIPVANKVKWSDIKKVEAYRTDETGLPFVCLKFSLFWGRPQITIDQDIVGFADLVTALAVAFPDISDDWQARIEAPIGYSRHEVLYEAT